jgi:Protein of unknown function (DUF1570)
MGVPASWSWVVLGCVACGSAIPPLPAQGGPAWTELKTEHFTLWTDTSAEHGRALVQRLEREHQVVTRVMNHATSRSPSFVIALRDAREAGAYLPDNVLAVAWPADATLQPGMLLDANTPDRDHAITHEMAHVVSFGLIANQPRWLAEGIAMYLEMAELDPGAKSVKVGLPRPDYLEYLYRWRSPTTPLAELFTCDHTCAGAAFYATSWAILSLLLNEHVDQFARYVQHLNELPAGRHAPGDREPFPDLPTAKLERELATWLVTAGGGIRLPRIELTVHDLPATERTLSAADVLAVRGLLALRFHRGAAQPAIDAALAADRSNVLAWLVAIELERAITVEEARTVAAAHPDDWRASWLLGLAAQRGPEAEAAFHQMCTRPDVNRMLCTPGSSR